MGKASNSNSYRWLKGGVEFSLEPAAKVAFSSKNLHTAAEAHLGVARSEPPELVVMVSRLCLRKALPVCPRVHRSRTHEDSKIGVAESELDQCM